MSINLCELSISGMRLDRIDIEPENYNILLRDIKKFNDTYGKAVYEQILNDSKNSSLFSIIEVDSKDNDKSPNITNDNITVLNITQSI